jgi:trimeric autotransporter adhesin
MAAVSLQPITPPATDAAGQPAARLATATAAGNGQPAATPNDTVSLSGAAVTAAQPGQETGQGGAEFLPAEPSLFEVLAAAGTNQRAAPAAVGTDPAIATAGVVPANAGAATVNVTANAAASTAVNSAATTNTAATANGTDAAAANAGSTLLTATAQDQQQQLAQLDQLLSSLGIDPQSIPLFNQLALLLYLNDPAGLQHFVQQIESVSPLSANPASAASTQAATQTPAQAAQGAAVPKGAGPDGQAVGALAAQLQELQVSLASTEVGTAQTSPTGSPSSPGQALDIKA